MTPRIVSGMRTRSAAVDRASVNLLPGAYLLHTCVHVCVCVQPVIILQQLFSHSGSKEYITSMRIFWKNLCKSTGNRKDAINMKAAPHVCVCFLQITIFFK